MANSVDPDQMPRSAAFDLGLHCLQRPICLNTKGYYHMFKPKEVKEYLFSIGLED